MEMDFNIFKLKINREDLSYIFNLMKSSYEKVKNLTDYYMPKKYNVNLVLGRTNFQVEHAIIKISIKEFDEHLKQYTHFGFIRLSLKDIFPSKKIILLKNDEENMSLQMDMFGKPTFKDAVNDLKYDFTIYY